MSVYYNENDPFAAAWLRELIKSGHIAKGEVDERSIEDVRPSDLLGFTQCHFFAGIGVWSHALRQAGWPDDRAVWTGSCPCQPFSAAGKRGGTSDERHLWPALYHLIGECSPSTFFGEQVASKDGLAWFDTVQSDLQAADYTVGAADLCAAGFGAPHIRQRLYFVADSDRSGLSQRECHGRVQREEMESPKRQTVVRRSDSGRLDNTTGEGLAFGSSGAIPRGQTLRQPERSSDASFWSAHDEIWCTDGRSRPIEPKSFPLVDGSTNRVGKLRGYGNAIVAPVAQAFIESFLEVETEERS